MTEQQQHCTCRTRREEKNKPKTSRGKTKIKIRQEINETEQRKMIEKIDKTKSQFFEKIKKNDKPSDRLRKKIRRPK